MRRPRVKTIAQTRGIYVLAIQKHLLDTLYKEKIKRQQDDLVRIAHENQQLLQCNTNTFFYNGKWYSGGDDVTYTQYHGGKRVYHCNKKLHPSIRNRVADLVDKLPFEWEHEKAIISNYLGILLKEAGNTLDLKACLPWQLHEGLARVHNEAFNNNLPWNEDQIAAFKEKHKDGLHRINCVYITKLLTE